MQPKDLLLNGHNRTEVNQKPRDGSNDSQRMTTLRKLGQKYINAQKSNEKVADSRVKNSTSAINLKKASKV